MGNTHIHAKTRQQIAEEYGISPRTLRRWLKNSNIQLPNRLLGPKEQLKIYQEFGDPNP
ncbi:MAG: helix-turn-helix domain-containing protein [Bacteroidota bacterium]